MNILTDEQLIEKYLKGDEKSLEQLIKRYFSLIFAYVKKYVGDNDNAADITQETFVKVWKNIRSFDRSKSFRSWIFTISKRTAIDWLRKNKALPFSAIEREEENIADSLIDNSQSIIEQLISYESSQQFTLAVAKLPPDYGSVINLRINDDLSFREIASKLKKPLNSVKSRYRRGLILLRKFLIK